MALALRHVAAVLLMGLSLGAIAGEVQVIDDFEFGQHGWYLVEGKKPPRSGPLCVMNASRDAKVGRGCARLRFQPCPDSWTHMQMSVNTLEWIGADCDRVAFWLKGDGSGETLNLMFGNYVIKPSLCFVFPVKLDFSDWRRFVVNFNDMEPKGKLSACLGRIVLVQLGVRSAQKPVDVLIDDIVALPAERGGRAGRFFDLDVLPSGGWDTPSPPEPVPVDHMRGIPPKVVLNRYVHGIRNHKKLHNPVEFAVDYPETGTFAVKISETSGHGGSRLIIMLDGQEVLRRDFPGETQTSLTTYQGYYAVEAPPGRHTIKVDNDGNDWLVVEAYRFGNYSTAGVRVHRDSGSVSVTLLDRNAQPLQGGQVGGTVAGQPLRFTREGAVFTSEPLMGRYPHGRYPVSITAKRGWETLFTTARQVFASARGLAVERTAFAVGQSVEFSVRYSDEANVGIPGAALALHFDGREHPMSSAGEGVYRAKLDALPAGAYGGRVRAAGDRDYPVKFVVYDPQGKPWEKEGIIRLDKNGRFVTRVGRPHMPWGYATIGLFEPNPDIARSYTCWPLASDDFVIAWTGLLRAHGVNCLRFGVNVDSKNIGGDLGGRANPAIMEKFRRFLDLVGPLGMRVIPVMWWGHYRNFHFEGIPAYDALIRKQADWFTNPQALELQKQYVREVAAPFRDDARILAWEVMNETYSAGDDLDAAIRWTNEIIAAIRSAAPRHLVTTSGCVATPAPEIKWMRDAHIDFFNYHAYPTYMDYGGYRKWAGNNTVREMGNYAAMMMLANKLGNKVNILGEAGNDRTREINYPEFRALITRDCLWLAFLCGSPGGITWDAIADPREFDVISRLAARIDWNAFAPAPAPIAVRVSDPDAELGRLAECSWWSLEKGVPIEFVENGASAALGGGRHVTSASQFSAPWFPKTHLAVSAGYQSKYMVFQDRRVFVAYVRNMGDILPQNVRTRSPRPLTIRVAGLQPGKLEVWDLDTRALVQSLNFSGKASLDLGLTRHDFALLVVP